jgi:protein TonB
MIKRTFERNILDEEGIQLLERRFRFVSSIFKRRNEIESDIRRARDFALIGSLALLIVFFQVWKQIETPEREIETPQLAIDVQEIPQTQQQKRAPAPSRPSVPIETEDEMIPEDATISDTEINLSELPPPPPPPTKEVDETAEIFVAYDEPPFPEGGFQAVHRNLVYPEIARKSSIEGKVLVQAKISEKGVIQDVRVLKSLHESCDEAAIAAIKSVRWKPAKQRDKPVAVWVTIPIVFNLS